MRAKRQVASFLKVILLEFYAANIAKYIIIHSSQDISHLSTYVGDFCIVLAIDELNKQILIL